MLEGRVGGIQLSRLLTPWLDDDSGIDCTPAVSCAEHLILVSVQPSEQEVAKQEKMMVSVVMKTNRTDNVRHGLVSISISRN